MTLFGKATDLSEILTQVGARVASALTLSADYVFASVELPEEMEGQGGPADQFVVLTGMAGRAIQPDVMGGGNSLLTFDGSLEVVLWNRLEVDQDYRDTAALSHATLGILVQWKQLLKASTGLQLYAPLPVAGGGQCILVEPMRVLSFDLRARLSTAGWTKLVSRWEIKWVQDQS